jgi:fatty-acyl-CoA synthase
VAEAAAIAVPHEKWGERPLLIVVPRSGCTPSAEALREFCRGKMPDWSIPDRVVIADSIPHGATGKIPQDRAAPPLCGAAGLKGTTTRMPRFL